MTRILELTEEELSILTRALFDRESLLTDEDAIVACGALRTKIRRELDHFLPPDPDMN